MTHWAVGCLFEQDTRAARISIIGVLDEAMGTVFVTCFEMTMTFSEYCAVLKGSSRELSLADAAAQFSADVEPQPARNFPENK